MTLVHYSMLIIENLIELWNQLTSNLEMLVISSTFILIILTLYFMRKPRKIYLVDFACYKPTPSYKCPKEHCMKIIDKEEVFTEESLEFVRKILERSGIGQDAYGSNGVLQIPQDLCIAEARKETEMVVFGAVDELLAKTGVKPADIRILVVNSSMFNPQPSISAMIVNRYKLRGNVLSFNLGGMGCSAGLISIHLAKDLLQPYLHESRHLHALRRARGLGGRFLNSKKDENQQENDSVGDKSQSNINLNSDKNDIASSDSKS